MTVLVRIFFTSSGIPIRMRWTAN